MGYKTPYIDTRFLKHINTDSIKTIFEIGARDLRDSIALSNRFPEATIYAYECNPATLDSCRANLRTFQPDRIIFNEIAVSDKVETLEFHNFLANKNPGASSFYKRHDYDQTQKTLHRIRTTTLEIELNKYNLKGIDLLCMDVQGWEVNILKGINLKENRISHVILESPNADSEYNGAPSKQEVEDFMISNNYEIKEIIYENTFEDNILFSLRDL